MANTKVKNTKHYTEGLVNNYPLLLTQDWGTLHYLLYTPVTCFMCYLSNMYDNNRDRIGIS